MKKLLPLPENFNPENHDSGHVHEWLSSQGFSVEGVSLIRPMKFAGDDTLYIDIVTSDELPDPLPPFVVEPTEEEKAAQELDNIDISKADIEQLRKAVGLIVQSINSNPRSRG